MNVGVLCLVLLQAAAPGDTSKPVDLGEIAYTGGAFTPDGRHFVYAVQPKDKEAAGEIRAVDIAGGKADSLGMVPLIRPQKTGKKSNGFRWSLGVLGAENDLGTVYVAQYGPNEDLDPREAVAWDLKLKAVVPGKPMPGRKEGAGAPAKVKLALNDLDAEAVKKRTTYQPYEKLPELVGHKEAAVELADRKDAIDVTEPYRELYRAAMEDYPKSRFPTDSGDVLVSDSLEILAVCGNWVFAHGGVYAHYGIHGRGYDRVLLINVATRKILSYPSIGSRSASGLRTGPLESAFLPAPDGKSAVGISNGRLTLYRLPPE